MWKKNPTYLLTNDPIILTIFGSDNGFAPVRRQAKPSQAIIVINPFLLLTGSIGTISVTFEWKYNNLLARKWIWTCRSCQISILFCPQSVGTVSGDICFDKQQGYWLVHSVPRFPDYSDRKYSYPDSGTHYGQTFLCMTLAYKYLDVIGMWYEYTRLPRHAALRQWKQPGHI